MQINQLREELRRERNRKVITVPVYAKTALPDDLQTGQVFVAKDASLCWTLGETTYTVDGTAL